MNKPPLALAHSETITQAVADLLHLFFEEEAFYQGKEIGRQLRWGDLEALGVLDEVETDLRVVDNPGMDIFGQPLSKKYTFECACPRCERTLAAARFAPHLEKCMGMGRNSSRIASRRLLASSSSSTNNNGSNGNNNNNHANANSGSESAKGGAVSGPVGTSSNPASAQNGDLPSEDEHFEEDDDDEDWSMERKRKSTKKAVDKISPKRKGPVQRIRHVDSLGASRGKRGNSPMVVDSPSSNTESSLHEGDEELSSLSLI